MKNLILAFIGGIIFTSLLSVSYSDVKSFRTNLGYTIPVKPMSTVYVVGTDNMYKYLNKGYQVQQMLGHNSIHTNIGFLMIKYK